MLAAVSCIAAAAALIWQAFRPHDPEAMQVARMAAQEAKDKEAPEAEANEEEAPEAVAPEAEANEEEAPEAEAQEPQPSAEEAGTDEAGE